MKTLNRVVSDVVRDQATKDEIAYARRLIRAALAEIRPELTIVDDQPALTPQFCVLRYGMKVVLTKEELVAYRAAQADLDQNLSQFLGEKTE